MPRNRQEADLFFCSVTPLQNVRNENLEVYCPELKRRSANTYHQVYIQVSKNSKTSYSNISEVLKDWRKDHPKRSRFMAMADKSKKCCSEVPIPIYLIRRR